MKPGGGRAKGMAFQTQIAKRWRDANLFPAAQSGYAQHRGGKEQADITGTPGWWFELKSHQRVSVHAAVKQATENAPAGTLRAAVCKENRGATIVAMPIEDWERVAKMLLDKSEALLGFAQAIGKWPGDETDDALTEAMRETADQG